MWSYIKEYQLIFVVGLIAGAWVLWQLKFVFAVLFGGYIVASVLLPIVNSLAARHIPRVIAVVLVGIGIAVALALPWVIIALRFNGELSHIGTPIRDQFESVVSSLSPIGIDTAMAQEWLSSTAVSFTSSTIGAVTGILTTIVIGLYLAYDWPMLLRRISAAGNAHAWVKDVIEKQVAELTAWSLGQLSLSAIVGVLVYIALTIIQFPYALMLGLIAGISELVPYIGPIASAVPAVFIALQMGLSETVLIIAIYGLIQQVENHALAPLVMRRAVYIHPIIIIAVILAGFKVMGIVGALFAVPLTAILWTTYKEIRTHTRHENPSQ